MTFSHLLAFALGALCLLPFWLRARAHASTGRRQASPETLADTAQHPQSPRRHDWQVFIERYEFPTGMIDRALGRCPKGTQRSDLDTGLRQFLLACGSNTHLAAAMPSKVIDEAWHEFLTYTRDYATFCDQAFGQMLHHVPESAMTASELTANHGTGMATAWQYACEQEGLPIFGLRAPVLFAADARAVARTLTKRGGVTKPPIYVGCCGADPSTAMDGACAAVQGTVCMLHTYTDQWARLYLLPPRIVVPAPSSAATGADRKSGAHESGKRQDASVATSGDDGGIASLTILAASCGSSSSDDTPSSSSCGSSSSSCGSSSSSSCGSSCGGGGD